MLPALLITLLTASGVEAWLAPSLIDPLDSEGTRPVVPGDNPRVLKSGERPDVEAALGEGESVLLFVRAGKKALTELSVEVTPVNDSIPAPRVRVPVPVASDSPGRPVSLDALVPARPRSLPAGNTAVYWLSYDIPRTASPGRFRHDINLMNGRKRVASVQVRIRVFGFTLPETPRLPILFGLDRAAMKRTLGVGETDLEAWKPLYDFLLRERIALSLTDGGALLEPATLQAHLAYVMETHPMAVVDLGGFDGATLGHFPAPGIGQVQDPMQFFLHDVMRWLAKGGWEERACLALGHTPVRTGWPEARRDYFRAYRADKRIPRLVAGEPHPFFDDYAEWWALPFARYSPSLVSRLSNGVGLTTFATPKAVSCEVYSGRFLPPTTLDDPSVADICDGSLFTLWKSPAAPTEKEPVTVGIHYSAPVTARTLTVIWQAGGEATDFDVRTAYDGRTFGKATIRWEHRGPATPYGMSVSTGRLKYEKTFQALRLRINNSVGGGRVMIAEIIPGEPEAAETRGATPLSPWLLLEQDRFPSLALGAHPAESRAAPWLCWGHGFKGILAGRVNAWSRAWRGPVTLADLAAGLPGIAAGALVYPGSEGLMSTVRLEHLRDGLEDYDYIQLLADRLRAAPKADPEQRALLRLPSMPRNPSPKQLNAWSGLFLQRRAAIGEALEADGAG